MSGLKTFFTVSTLSILIGVASGGLSYADTSQTRLALMKTFAQCAGRLSAQMEHQWMFDGVASDQTKLRRAAVIDLLDSMVSRDDGRTVLHWRIDAKMAHASLLTRATFNTDTSDAKRAGQVAARLIAECDALMLS